MNNYYYYSGAAAFSLSVIDRLILFKGFFWGWGVGGGGGI